MNTDVEDLLREGMERFTADLQAPAGMTRRAERRHRQRLALRSATTVAAALTAGVVALVTVGVPGAGRDGVDTTAYVVKRVDGALSAAEPGDIAQMTVTTRSAAAPGGTTTTTTAEEWSYGDQWRSVTYSSAGHPVYDEGYSASSVYTLVSYLTRTWTRQSGLGRPAALAPLATGPPGCAPLVAGFRPLFRTGLPGIGFPVSSLPAILSSLPATVATALRTAVSCGTLTVAGRQRIDGIEAIELTSRPGSLISETIWVSPGSYLPVRAVIRPASGTPFPEQTADITWLPPTAQNLAKLTVPIPAGFRHVPLAEAVRPILQQILGGPRQTPNPLCVAYANTACKDGTSSFPLPPGGS